MINIYWAFFEICLCLVEIFLFDVFLSGFVDKKEKISSWQRYGFMFGIGMMVYAKDACNISIFGDTLMPGIIICCLLYGVYAVVNYQMRYYQYIVFIVLFLCVVLTFDMLITYSMALILSVDVQEALTGIKISRFTCAVTSKAVLFAFVMLFSQYNKRNKEELSKLSTRLLLYEVIISTICLYTVGCFVRLENHFFTPQQELCLCVFVLGIFGINVLVYVMVNQLNERVIREKKMEMVQYHNNLLEKTILENKTLEMEWRRNRHDFNNHLSCIDMLLQMENITKARAYIQNLTENYMGSAGNIDVGNEIANAVLNQKWIRTNKNQINFNIDGTLPEVVDVDQVDICAILSNSIDNAIEAVLKIEEIEKRSIDVYIKSYDKYLIFEISNTVKEMVTHTSEKLETTKEDKNHHGVGMTSMQMIVDKYKGHMEWSCQDFCFHLVILLPYVAE